MFYSELILSKRGPLAKVWLAAHAERRLTKTQLLQTDIGQSVSTIIGPNGTPMALRLSGQLLLGVVRIYSRKAKYLLDDCNDALIKLKTAFRSGGADFTTEIAHTGSHSNVTLPVVRSAYDLSLPDPALEGWDAESSIAGGSAVNRNRYTARPADITLRRYLDPDHASNVASSFGWASGDFFDPDGSQAHENAALSSPDQRAAAMQRRDSQGRLVDENGDLIEEGDGDDMSSLGIGRDAQRSLNAGRPSLAVGDLTGFDSFGGDDFLMPDVGGDMILDLGLEEFDAQRRSMTPAGQTSIGMDTLTPRTALRVQQAAQKRAAAAQKIRKQIVDSRTQLDDNRRGGATGIVLAEDTLLPRSRAHLQLLELSEDPSKGLLPFYESSAATAGNLQTLSAARFLAPQLSELFTFDASLLMRNRIRALPDDGDDDAGRLSKRIRSSSAVEGRDEDDFGSEIGRRAADVSRLELNLRGDADVTFDDFDAIDPMDDITFDAPAPFDDTLGLGDDAAPHAGPRRSQRKRITVADQEEREAIEEDHLRRRAFHVPGDLQRLVTPSDGSVIGSSHDTDLSPTSSYPLRAFDSGGNAVESGAAAASAAATALGISRNTARALKVLRTHLPQQVGQVDAEDGEGPTAPQQMHFSDVTRNASRHAAAAFFFEILALSTKDCLRIEQDDSFGEIVVEAKPSLWTLEQQRAGSVGVAVS